MEDKKMSFQTELYLARFSRLEGGSKYQAGERVEYRRVEIQPLGRGLANVTALRDGAGRRFAKPLPLGRLRLSCHCVTTVADLCRRRSLRAESRSARHAIWRIARSRALGLMHGGHIAEVVGRFLRRRDYEVHCSPKSEAVYLIDRARRLMIRVARHVWPVFDRLPAHEWVRADYRLSIAAFRLTAEQTPEYYWGVPQGE
jgi:hypothetical protein